MPNFFCPNGRTQHVISVVYENQCASDLFYERMNLCAKYSVFILYTYFVFFCVIVLSPLVRAILCAFPDSLRKYQISY